MGRARRKPAIIVHGGAWAIPKTAHRAHIEGVRAAAERGISRRAT